MILIAESGSTKCNWVLSNNKGKRIDVFNTIGFNPYFIDSENIIIQLNKSDLSKYKSQIKSVFFYGAGCSSKDKNTIVKKSLTHFFNNAIIQVKHDLDAACFAMYNDMPNITCILGTGSNSCYFDGKKIIENAPSLGFIIGDEASGNYFGKKILQLYFNKLLNKELVKKFEKEYETDWPTIVNNIYNHNRANVYLSKYFPFMIKNKTYPIINNIIFEALEKFFKLHVLCYNNHKDVDINFVGSVAYFLSDEIYKTATKYNCKIGGIIKNPIEKLTQFHLNQINL
tara:strand:+ start:281 stop:1132 length:852 start_codon:yes stop_codon:yes gene_type:complete